MGQFDSESLSTLLTHLDRLNRGLRINNLCHVNNFSGVGSFVILGTCLYKFTNWILVQNWKIYDSHFANLCYFSPKCLKNTDWLRLNHETILLIWLDNQENHNLFTIICDFNQQLPWSWAHSVSAVKTNNDRWSCFFIIFFTLFRLIFAIWI